MIDLNQQWMDVAPLDVRASELDTVAKYVICARVTLIAALRHVIDSLCDSAWAVNPTAQSRAADVPDMKSVLPVCLGRQTVRDAEAAVAMTKRDKNCFLGQCRPATVKASLAGGGRRQTLRSKAALMLALSIKECFNTASSH